MKKFINENLQTLGAPVQDIVVTATWHPGFVHPYINMLRGVRHCTLSKAFELCTPPLKHICIKNILKLGLG